MMPLTGYYEVPSRPNTTAPIDARLNEVLNGQLKWLTSTYVVPGNLSTSNEVNIRGAAMAAYALAVITQTQVYDAALSGIPNYMTAVNKANSIITGVSAGHLSTTPGGWGHESESSLWAGICALAGWLHSPYLTTTQITTLLTMVESEADWRLTQTPRYMYARDGTVLTPGNTGAEENAWNALIPAVAYCMMPTHPHAGQWLTNAVQFWMSAFSHRDDLTSGATVNGLDVGAFLQGYNVEPDYTVSNHNITPDADYMTCINLAGSAAVAFGLAGRDLPKAAFWNYDKVYAALSTPLPAFNGETIYLPGQPLPSINYPAGNDWGTRRPSHYVLTDQVAALYGLDSLSERPGGYWERVHMYDVWNMQHRYTDGHLFANSTEDKYGAREQLAAYHLTTGWMLKWCGNWGRDRVTDADYL